MDTVLDLKYPIQISAAGGSKVELKTVTIRRPKAKDLKYAPREGKTSTPHDMIPFIAVLTGLKPEEVDEMDLEDISAIGRMLDDFVAGYRESGKESSGVSPQLTTSLPEQSGT